MGNIAGNCYNLSHYFNKLRTSYGWPSYIIYTWVQLMDDLLTQYILEYNWWMTYLHNIHLSTIDGWPTYTIHVYTRVQLIDDLLTQ